MLRCSSQWQIAEEHNQRHPFHCKFPWAFLTAVCPFLSLCKWQLSHSSAGYHFLTWFSYRKWSFRSYTLNTQFRTRPEACDSSASDHLFWFLMFFGAAGSCSVTLDCLCDCAQEGCSDHTGLWEACRLCVCVGGRGPCTFRHTCSQSWPAFIVLFWGRVLPGSSGFSQSPLYKLGRPWT